MQQKDTEKKLLVTLTLKFSLMNGTMISLLNKFLMLSQVEFPKKSKRRLTKPLRELSMELMCGLKPGDKQDKKP